MSRQITPPVRSPRAGASSSVKPVMKVWGGPGQNPAIALDRAISIVGRSGMHVSLDAPTVSRTHALIVVDPAGGGAYVRDLASRNGIAVNGANVRESPLVDAATLRVGAFTLKCESGFSPGGAAAGEPPTAPAAHLHVDGHDVPIPPGQRTVLIGSREGCDIELADPQVTTTHAVIAELGGARHVRDLGSEHGTFVNGKRVRQHELKDGDEIRVGNTTLRYVLGALRAERPAASVDASDDSGMPWDEVLGTAGADEATPSPGAVSADEDDDEAVAAAIAAEVLAPDAGPPGGATEADRADHDDDIDDDDIDIPARAGSDDVAGTGIAAHADALAVSAEDLLAAEREAAVQEAYELAAIDAIAPAVDGETDADTDGETDASGNAAAAGEPLDVAEAAPVPSPPKRESRSRLDRTDAGAARDDNGADGPVPIEELANVDFIFGPPPPTSPTGAAPVSAGPSPVEVKQAEGADAGFEVDIEEDHDEVELVGAGEAKDDVADPARRPAPTEAAAEARPVDVGPAAAERAPEKPADVTRPNSTAEDKAPEPARPEPGEVDRRQAEEPREPGARQVPLAAASLVIAPPASGVPTATADAPAPPAPVEGAAVPPANLPVPLRPPLGARRRPRSLRLPGVAAAGGLGSLGAFADAGPIQPDAFAPGVPTPPKVPMIEPPLPLDRADHPGHDAEPELMEAAPDTFDGEVIPPAPAPPPPPPPPPVEQAAPAPTPPAEHQTSAVAEAAAIAPAPPAVAPAPRPATPDVVPSAPSAAPARSSRKARRAQVRQLQKQIITLTARVAALEAALVQPRQPDRASQPGPVAVPAPATERP